jgi:hypothetical protein
VIDTGFFDIITRKYGRPGYLRLKLPSLVFLYNTQNSILKYLLIKNMNILPGARNYHIDQHRHLHFVINLFLRLYSPFTASPAPTVFAEDPLEKIYRLREMISPLQTLNLFYRSLSSQLHHTAIAPPGKKEIDNHIEKPVKSHTPSLYQDSGLAYQTFLQDSKMSNLNMFPNLADRLIPHPGTAEIQSKGTNHGKSMMTAARFHHTGHTYPGGSSISPIDYKLFYEVQNQESFHEAVTHRYLSKTFDHHQHMAYLSHLETTVNTLSTINISSKSSISSSASIVSIARTTTTSSAVSTTIARRTGINKATGDDAAPDDPRKFFPVSPDPALHYFAPPISAASAAREAAALSSASAPGINPGEVTYPKIQTAAGKASHTNHSPEVPGKPMVDLGHLTDQVYRMLERKLRVEKERRGW